MRLRRPLVSIIVASYNHENFVEEAIRSVLDQTVKDIEVLVVDDGSSDGTAKVLDQIKDSRLKITKLKENRKYHPRNLALRSARGKYIAFQNSDDVWAKNKLELQLNALSENKSLAACFTAVEIIDASGNVVHNSWANGLFKTANRTNIKQLRRFFDIGNCYCISSAIFSRRTFKKVGFFDESLMQLSDFDLWIRCAAVGDLHVINKPLTKMRIVENVNASTPNPQSHRRTNMELIQVLQRFASTPGINISKIFPDVCPNAELPKIIQQAYLAQYAWSKAPPHRLFADRLFSTLVANSKHRNMITDHFEPGIFFDFLQKRSELEIISHE